MNIFCLDPSPKLAAQYHVDKHAVKMIVEHCQLLSTAHRILDGEQIIGKSNSGRSKKTWNLSDSKLNSILYSATHINHPSGIWTRSSKEAYLWLHEMTVELCKEYTHRYHKIHKCESSGLLEALSKCPENIGNQVFTLPTPAMPDDMKVPGDVVKSYMNYYFFHKQKLMTWTNREVPAWLLSMCKEYSVEENIKDNNIKRKLVIVK